MHGQWLTVVGSTLHLGNVPVGGKIAQVHGTHVGAHTLHLLQVPQREGVVVAVAEDDGIFVNALQVVLAKVAGTVAARAVVVVPGLAYHLQRHCQAYDCCNASKTQCHSLVGFWLGSFFLAVTFFLLLDEIHG